MPSRIGAEIRRRDRPAPPPPAARPARRSEHVLDLRDQAPAPAPRPREPEVVVHDRIAEDVARTLSAPAPVQRSVAPTRPAPAPRPAPAARPTPAPAPPPAVPAKAPKPSRSKFQWNWRRVLVRTAQLVITLIGAGVFLMMNEVPLPERLIGIYFVASLVYNIDSQRTFLVALLFLAMVAASSAIGKSVPAENYAVYAFYFLVIGLVAAIREQVMHRGKPADLALPTDQPNR